TAVALWRQEPALAGTDPAGWAVAEVERLAEVRLSTIEDLWDAQLRLGRHAAAPAELERLLVGHPAPARPVGLPMLARYRWGRPPAALDVSRRLRAQLAELLGTEPDPELARLHTRILRRDPALVLGSAAGDATGRRAAGSATTAPAAMPRPAQLPAPVG